MKVYGKNPKNTWKWLKQKIINTKLKLLAKKVKTFIQVGSAGGGDLTNQLARKYDWQGVLVEPDEIIEEAKKNYKGLKTQFHRAVIADKDGTTILYQQRDSKKGRTIEKSFSRNKNKDLEKIKVKTMTLKTLFEKAPFDEADYFISDVEGYDWVIINQLLDLGKQPKIIFYESMHLSKEHQDELLQRLRKKGYKTFTGLLDTIAVKLK